MMKAWYILIDPWPEVWGQLTMRWQCCLSRAVRWLFLGRITGTIFFSPKQFGTKQSLANVTNHLMSGTCLRHEHFIQQRLSEPVSARLQCQTNKLGWVELTVEVGGCEKSACATPPAQCLQVRQMSWVKLKISDLTIISKLGRSRMSPN